jgi:glycosyltransferase involved in cell wall biosynthesis
VTRLSIVILTLNEEVNLPGALASAAFADEVLIVDSGSTDSTVEVAIAAGVRVVERPFEDFAHQRNVALELVSGEWICFLDADERISPALADELIAVTRGSEGEPRAHSSYRIRREAIALGERLRWHPGGDDAPVRLMRRGTGTFEGAVHERYVAADGASPGMLTGIIEHRTHRTVSELVQRVDRYSTLEARELAARGARVVPPWRLPWTMASTAWRYWRSGLKQHGMAGAIEACTLAFDRVLVLAKIWEAHEADRIAAAYRDDTPARH